MPSTGLSTISFYPQTIYEVVFHYNHFTDEKIEKTQHDVQLVNSKDSIRIPV